MAVTPEPDGYDLGDVDARRRLIREVLSPEERRMSMWDIAFRANHEAFLVEKRAEMGPFNEAEAVRIGKRMWALCAVLLDKMYYMSHNVSQE